MSFSNVEIIHSLYEAFARRDMPAILSVMASEVDIVQSAELPWGGEYSGPAALQKFLGALLQHLDAQIEVERFINAGEPLTPQSISLEDNAQTF